MQEYLALSQAQRVLLCSVEACRSMALRHVPRFQYFRLLKRVGGVLLLEHNLPVSAHGNEYAPLVLIFLFLLNVSKGLIHSVLDNAVFPLATQTPRCYGKKYLDFYSLWVAQG